MLRQLRVPNGAERSGRFQTEGRYCGIGSAIRVISCVNPDGKSNEITAIPELLDTLRLDGSIVTLDAMRCQKDIAARIRAKGADYLLALKANHGRAFEAAQGHFERTCFSRGAGGRPACDAFDDSHGRLVRRRVF